MVFLDKVEIKRINPKKLITSKRLDVVVRYLYFRDMKYGNIKEEIKSLYCRMIFCRTAGIEPVGAFSSGEKSGIDDYLCDAKDIFHSIRENGFLKEKYIPVNSDGFLLNGAHRLSASLALGKEVYIKQCGDAEYTWDYSWFCQNNFSTEDKIRILRGFTDLYENCGIILLWGPVKDKWDFISQIVKEKLDVVGEVDLDFQNDIVCFQNVIYEIYGNYDKDSIIGRKIDILKLAELSIRVIVVSDEQNIKENLYETIIGIKKKIRKVMHFESNEQAFATLHASDNREEFLHLKETLLSVNNIKYMGRIPQKVMRREFCDWISEFKLFMRNKHFRLNEACIVGSSPLEVLGIRNSTDIDIVVSSRIRNIYGDGVTHLSDNLDLCTRNYVRGQDGVLISDEQLLEDDSYYFKWYDCRFVNMELVQYRKSWQARNKDKMDVKLINIYLDYYKYFDHKKALQWQIIEELKRRGIKNIEHSNGNPERERRLESYYKVLNLWLQIKFKGLSLSQYFERLNYKKICIYGGGELGKNLIEELKKSNVEIAYVIDKNGDSSLSKEIMVLTPEDDLPSVDIMVCTVVFACDEIKKKMKEKVSFPIVSLDEVVQTVKDNISLD